MFLSLKRLLDSLIMRLTEFWIYSVYGNLITKNKSSYTLIKNPPKQDSENLPNFERKKIRVILVPQDQYWQDFGEETSLQLLTTEWFSTPWRGRPRSYAAGQRKRLSTWPLQGGSDGQREVSKFHRCFGSKYLIHQTKKRSHYTAPKLPFRLPIKKETSSDPALVL